MRPNNLLSLPYFILLLGLFVLGGCSGNNEHADLRAKMAEIKAKPRGRIEPPPEFTPIAPVAYSAHQLRNPFSPSSDEVLVSESSGRQVEPDFTRPKEYLERFTLDSLRMKGVLSRPNGPLFALLEDPTGATNRVKVGDHLGKNFGQVAEVNETVVSVLEIVPDGQDGWVERPRTIKLAE